MSVLIANLAIALAYLAGSYAGILLAIPPGNASPVWPAAGIALAAILIWGKKLVPGILLGAFCAELYLYANQSTAGMALATVTLAAVIATGTTLQAVVGAWLIERFNGRDNPLIENRDIIRFLLLGGPVSCVIGATVAVMAMLLAAVINMENYPLTWGTWWAGDIIGVAIFAPVLLILFGRPREIWRGRIKSMLYPLLVLLVMVMALFQYGKWQDRQRLKFEFERQVNLLHRSIDNRVLQYFSLNTALKAYFDGSQEVTEEEFNIFAESLALQRPDIQALEWIPRVRREQRAAFEAGWRGPLSILEPDENMEMVPAPEREEYFPIRYVVPVQGNEMVRGYNILFNPQARANLEQARDSSGTVVSAPLRLLQDRDKHNRTGHVFYSPVYATRTLPSIEERRAAFKGLVASVFRLDTEIAAALENLGASDNLYLRVRDDRHQLFDNIPAGAGQDVHRFNLTETADIGIGNRTWHFTYLPSEIFFQKYLYWNLWILLLGCMMVAVISSYGLFLLSGNTLRIAGLVRQRTRELDLEAAERRQMMNEREAHNRILHAIVSMAPIDEILLMIVRLTEATNPEQICSILLLDDDGKHVKQVIAPDLPDFYNDAVRGLEIGVGQGSCGTAMATGKCVVAEDIETHPYWRDYREVARRAGLRACWSEPILDSNAGVLGSFALYFRTPKAPAETDIGKIQDLAQLASIAIERKSREHQIQRLAYYDVLTDLPNRRLLLDWLEQQIASVSRHNEYGAMLFIDLDNFKTLNDSLGHQVGDKLLIQIAQRLRTCMREEDTVARLGGDEFVILPRDTYPDPERISEHVLVLAERVRTELNQPYQLDEYVHHITPSIGITVFSKDNTDADEILRQADAAMYSAKAKGRNTVSFYHPDMQKFALDRLALEKDLRVAVSGHQFMLYYQPIYDAQRRITGAEALLRWQHPLKGTILPDEFIAEAEDSGLILPIGEWVLEETCRQLAQWPQPGYISVNISAVQLQQTDFIETIKLAVSRHNIDHNRLLLEMTETSMVSDLENTRLKMDALRNLGIPIAIDDFGTGYSSLGYLKNLPLNQLKIDKGFVRDIETDNNDRTIVDTIIAMAQHLNLNVVAEGVETEYQWKFLQEKGCNGFQGYYLSKPLPAEEFQRLLQGENAIADSVMPVTDAGAG